MSITRDDWLTALNEAGYTVDVDDQSAVTIGEFAEMFQVTTSTAQSRLDALVKAGKATVTQKWGTTSYGRRVQYKAFRLVK